MAFPTNPSVGNTFVYAGKTFRWDGESWSKIFSGISTLTTDNVSESGNLYFTNTRSVSAITPGTGIVIDSNGRVTANVTSGTNAKTVFMYNILYGG